jgi:hypothetical protein
MLDMLRGRDAVLKKTLVRTSDFEFGRVLADVRDRSAEAFDGSAGLANPAATIAFSFADSELPAGVNADYWDDALAWIAERENPDAPRIGDALASESPEAIAAALGLDNARTQHDLDVIRRVFMWRYHPDRHDETDREALTRRVAIANMLIDQSQLRLQNAPRKHK